MFIFALVLAGLIIGYWLFMSPFSQLFGPYPYEVKTDEKIIALTFDDGPNEPYTSQILAILNSRNIKATFFQVGKRVERYPEVTKAIDQSGHTIGNHSLSHVFFNYFLQPPMSTEIVSSQAILTKTLAKTPALFRSPWLWRSPSLFKTLKIIGLQPVSGRFCSAWEVFQIDGQKIARTAVKKAKPGAIIIFHDGFDAKGGNRAQTVKAVEITVDELLKQGYKFVTIDQLFNIPAYKTN